MDLNSQLVDTNSLSTREEVENKIDECHQYIRHLKHRLNGFTNIGRLPPEILSDIFFWHQAIIANVTPLKAPTRLIYTGYTPFMWLAVSHVCHHWRTVALTTSSLWTRIETQKAPYVEELITRSQASPLHVDFWRNSETDDQVDIDAHRLVLQQHHRLQSIHLFITPEHYDQLSDVLPSIFSPSLSSLVVRAREYYDPFPEFIANCQTHALARLGLHGFRLWRHPIIRPPIIDLTVEYDMGSYTCSEILSTLSSLPLLERLTLTIMFRYDSSEVNLDAISLHPPKSIVHLDRLSYFKIRASGTALAGAYFISSLQFPSDASTNIAFTEVYTKETLTCVLQPILARFSDASPTLWSTMAIALNKCQIALWKDERTRLDFLDLPGDDSEIIKHPPHFILSFLSRHGIASDKISPCYFVDMICSRIPISNIRCLLLKNFQYPTDVYGRKSIWEKVFRAMPLVHTLRADLAYADKPLLVSMLEGALGSDICYRALYSSRVRGNAVEYQLPLPNLKTLEFDGASFYEEILGESPYLSDLRFVLTYRSQIGTPITRLTFTKCEDMQTKDARTLSQLVENFDWKSNKWADLNVDKEAGKGDAAEEGGVQDTSSK